MQNLFIITAIGQELFELLNSFKKEGTILDKANWHKTYSRKRIPAICTNKERAIFLVENNAGDMYECGHYPYVVIESIVANHATYIGTVVAWYSFDSEKETYVPIDTPMFSNPQISSLYQ